MAASINRCGNTLFMDFQCRNLERPNRLSFCEGQILYFGHSPSCFFSGFCLFLSEETKAIEAIGTRKRRKAKGGVPGEPEPRMYAQDQQLLAAHVEHVHVRAAYTAVYDRYSFQSATFLFFLPGLPTNCCCECSRRPWGMCLSLMTASINRCTGIYK